MKALSLLIIPLAFALPVSSHASEAGGWGLEPLGPEVKRGPAPVPTKKRVQEPGFSSRPGKGTPVTLVENGKVTSIIIIPDDASPEVRAAAKRVASAIQKMSGSTIPVLPESKSTLSTTEEGGLTVLYEEKPVSAILIGETKAGKKLGYRAGELREEGLRVVTLPSGGILVYGRDLAANGMKTEGTRYAVAHFLERQLGCRWLWPGKSGEVIPERKTISIAPVDETDAPALPFRVMRASGYLSERALKGVKSMGRSEEEFRRQVAAYQEWTQVQKLGASVKLHYQHAYHGWGERFMKQHPEWFALQPNGTRKQELTREVLAFTNAALADEVAREKIAELAADPALVSASISPNDGSSVNSICMSEEARKLDPPNGDPVKLLFNLDGKRVYRKYPSLTDRYLTFFNRVAEKVAAAYPDRYVAAYAYGPYRSAPLYQPVHPNLMVCFVGFTYGNEYQRTSDRDKWDGWASRAKYIILRPNALLSGGAYPMNYGRKMASDLAHCYETGMAGADFSSVAGHWSNIGLNYYLLPRLLWNPTADVDAMINDYLEKGFGPAAPVMARYFAKVEALNGKVAEMLGDKTEAELRDDELDVIKSSDAFMNLAPAIYNEAAVQELHALLAEAKGVAGNDPKIRERIAFIEQGVAFADLQTRLYTSRDAKTPEEKARMRELLDERYRLFQNLFDANFYSIGLAHLNWKEAWMTKKEYGWQPPALEKPVAP